MTSTKGHRHIHYTRDVVLHASQYIHGDVLDLGAGTAKYRRLIEPFARTYTTFDLYPGKQIDMVGDISNTTLPDESYDTIISTQVLEHVSTPWKVAHEMHRLLKNNGIAIVSAPFMQPYHADPFDYYRYSKEGLRAIFEMANFVTVECAGYSSFSIVMYEMIQFSILNPYEKRSAVARLVSCSLQKVARWLDNDNPQRIYGNSYLIAKKTALAKSIG